ncbi:MAG: SDR family NAD(P)-dependent oxidoreductase [Candidatus Heimdallarchaeaceae archaeon]
MVKKVHYSNKAFFDEGKVIVVTGASSGIGRAVCLALTRYHPKLVIIARRKKQLLQTAHLLKKEKIEVLPIVGDVRNREDREKLIEFTMKSFGRIDVLINNAGLGKANLFIEQPEEEIDQLIETNVLSLIKMTKQVLPIMKQQESGLIINMSSSLALLPVYPFAVYCATKSAVKVFSDSIRQEFKDYGILVSTVMPGPYDTEFNKVAGLNGATIPSFAVENLADAVAELVVKPKKNLIRPKSYVLLIWFTKKFESVKNFITLKIAQMIDKGRIEKLDKLKDKNMSPEEAIDITSS